MKKDTQALNALPVQSVGKLLGIKLPNKGMAHCPLPGHTDKNPSFEVRPNGRRWVCYACNKKGGSIDLVMAFQGIPFLEARDWLAEMSGIGRPVRRSTGSHSRPRHRNLPTQQPNGPEVATETPPDTELYAAFLFSAPLRKSGIDYLRGRKLTEEIVARFAIGQMPGIVLIDELINRFGFARVKASGLLTKPSTSDRYWPIFPEGALLFPYLEVGRITYFQARIINRSHRGPRWRNLNQRSRRVYNKDVLTEPKINRIAICEGAIDVLSATQLGCEAIGLIGVSAKLEDTEMMDLRGKQVELLLDWDDAGEKRSAALRKELARFGVTPTRKTAPRSGAKDVNDYLREGNKKI